MSKASPSSRSMALLRREGFTVAQVERWIPHRRIRIDLFGIGDLVACRAGDSGPLMIQTTSLSNLASRKTKALAEPRLKVWLACGGRFELHGWSKRGVRWVVRRVQLHGDDLTAVEMEPKPPRRKRAAKQRELFSLD